MLWSPRTSLSNIRVKLTAKGLLRNLQLLSGCGKSTVEFHTVDKAKKRAGPRIQQPAQGKGGLPAAPSRDRAAPRAQGEDVQRLRSLLAAGGRRFEAVAVVIQHVLSERDKALKQCSELSQELVTLREELVSSAASCQQLEKEKDELRSVFEGVLQKAQQQHQNALAELEEQLSEFYSAEWDKVHQAYQQEADRCRSQAQQQINDLRSKHEALEKEVRSRHTEEMESFRQQYEASLEELRNSHEQERQDLTKTLTETEATLSEQIEELTRKNKALNEKLKAEEEHRRLLRQKSQKDPHTLYLEQELDSLKVVLEMKNSELHQQSKKLMELETLMEANMKLDGDLKKSQQENEDLRARLEEHTALHRQLSTEQAVLQQTIQKESKMNNRLSLQNEELLWKLHNGDIWGPRKLPPSPPFQPTRSSGSFSGTPLSSN
ncbi:microtubule-associated tumor suppressor 1 homolog A-like isoform X2 [Megalops cyprinoides]|uniref:microtubule-associated tumor suppressor 1 homolog A-like isoform X2 n=1 Tax=Megalops cyprinoides TaxID=118141 RepID=UPI00186470D7|nr:microtubule-associated tumor suppressor 1 homolog A-like isoform X2 [Megalops cyprinoides]